MITDWREQSFPIPIRYRRLAMAYLDAAEAACLLMTRDPSKQTWPAASVVLLLEAHATELFLKGAILSRAPEEGAKLRTHNLNALKDKYFELFPEPEFEFEVPFAGHVYLGFSEEEFEEPIRQEKKDEEPHSLTYRYPVDITGKARDGVRGMEPTAQIESIRDLRDTLSRIASAM